MCSRYFLDADGNIIAYTFRVPPTDRVTRRYNIAPTQDAPVIRMDRAREAREVAMLRWGLVPSWAKDLAVGTRMINARGESVEEKPAFREAMRKRRCIVPASGFYEWQGAPGRKQPYAITLAGGELFGFAGLWESWQAPSGQSVQTFAIVTTEANAAIAPIHDRMPVIVALAQVDAWLMGTVEEARSLVKPYEGATGVRAVTRRVSDVRAEGPECLDDAEPTWGSQQQLL